MNVNRRIFLLMLIIVPIAGELRLEPSDVYFRFSLGTPAFFFFLLWLRSAKPLLSGTLTGAVVVGFRVFLEWVFLDSFHFEDAFRHHYAVFFYYTAYSLLFYYFRMNHFYRRPIILGLLGVTVEILASIVELSCRALITSHLITLPLFIEVMVIAVIRTFFAIGLFSVFMLRESQLAEREQHKRNEQILLVISGLYQESINIRKMEENAETITRGAYELYRRINNSSTPESKTLAQGALKLAGQIHEIKKDSQRIFANLSQIISDEKISSYMNIEELGDLIIKSNERYALLLGKEITFKFNLEGEHPKYHTYTVLSLMNNLVANAVEAIKETGQITISIQRVEDFVMFHVTDNGSGVSPHLVDVMFEPGFTTKFDVSGKPSTGIGLSYVKQVIENLGGQINLKQNADHQGITFVLSIPVQSLSKKE